MRRHLLTLLSGMLLSAFIRVSPAYAFGWPTFDLGEVFNTIQSTISQVQTQISTTMETYSIANIQQAIGDKLGGLQKIKDAKAKIEKAREKAEQIKKRAEKVMELKKKYEEAAKNAINQVQDAYSTAQGYVNDVKNQVENVKGQVEGTINNVKGQVENVKNQVEGTINNVKGQVENVKNQIENVKGQVENTVNNVNSQVNDLFGSPEDNFDFENNSSNGGSAGFTQTNNNTGFQTDGGTGIISGGSFGEDTLGNVNEQTLGGSAQAGAENGFVRKTSEDVEELTDIEWGDGTKVEEEEVVVKVKKDIELKNKEDLSEIEISEQPVEKIKSVEIKTDEINKKGEVIKSKIDLINEREILVSPKDADKLNLKEAPDIKGRTEVKAFKKVSFYQDFKTSHAAQTGSMKTGTDDEGNFYFPDAFAQWVGINFDDTPDEQKLWDGIEKICADLKSSENHQTQEFDHRFDYDIVGQMRANAQAHSAVSANEAESGKTVDDLSNMIDAAGGTTMTQISGMGEIGAAQVRQNRQEIVRLSDDVLSRVFDEIRSYCFYWPETAADAVPTSGFKTGTDNDGNYYFPQRMAEWCSLNFDDNITEQVMEDCMTKIASEYYAAKDDVARQARIRFRKMKMEAVINAFITAHNAKKQFANDKEEDAVEQINTDDADSERTMTSGNAEINKKLMAQMGQIDLLRFSLAELDNLNTIENDGEVFLRKGEREQ